MNETTKTAKTTDETAKTNAETADETAKTNAEITKEIKAHISDTKDKLSKMSKTELKAEAEYLCTAFNEAKSADNTAATKAIEEFLSDVVIELNAECRHQCFVALKATSNPILEGCKQLSYTGYAARDRKSSKDDSATKRVIEETQRSIDLLKLHDFLDKVSGADSNWPHRIQKLNMQLAVRMIKELSVPEFGEDGKVSKTADKVAEERIKALADTYRMSDTAKDIKSGVDVSTNTKLGKTLQTIVDMMLGEGVCKVRTQDVRFLISLYTKEGRSACTVQTSNHVKLCKLVKELIHASITRNFQYGVEYDRVKAK